MEFARVVGNRRSVRWYQTDQPIERSRIQRVLEAARLTGCPGNAQPWRAVVVEAADLTDEDREVLLSANNWQKPQTLAPVWIYWFADPSAVTPQGFADRVRELQPSGAVAPDLGWTVETVEDAILKGVPTPHGLPPLHLSVHALPHQISVFVAMQETNGACQVAQLAAVADGLGTCLLAIATLDRVGEVQRVLGLPETFVPVWIQLLGESAESPEAGGQRPRLPFERLFALGRWGDAFPRDPEVVTTLQAEGMLQAPAPLPGRFEELTRLTKGSQGTR